MNIEDRVFERSRIDKEKLLLNGFCLQEGTYYLTEDLTDDLYIIVSYDTKIKVEVKDREFDEEYLAYRYVDKGTYASKVAYEIETFLIDLKDRISDEDIYINAQTLRMHEYMSLVYGKPDFPFDDNKRYGTYRDSSSMKWYALIMDIDYRKLDEKLSGKTEIINLKADKKEISSLIKKNGIYPAYHMNKANWISVVLDDTLKDEDIIMLINSSYDLVETAKNTKKFYRKHKGE